MGDLLLHVFAFVAPGTEGVPALVVLLPASVPRS
jgi:hypothetical protein